MGVSYDPPTDNKVFAEQEGFPYRLLSDVDKSVAEAYGVRRPPDHEWEAVPRRISFLIDPEGIIRYIYIVKDVLGHPSQVLHDIRTARSG